MWIDASGKYQVKARFVSLSSDGVVRLQKADGQYVRVALAKLSGDDRRVVHHLNRALVMN
jgi:hypothetical protein